MLGVVFGVGSVVAMLSVGEGASKEALEQIRKLGSNNIIISAAVPVEDESTKTAGSFMSIYGLTFDDYDRIQVSYPSVHQIAPVKLMRKESRLG
ncbi:macrolide export ATP-binding/permease MacB, partial [bacterium]